MENNAVHTNNNEIVIEVKNLKKSFDGVVVLDGIDMTVHKGENFVVLGRSGSGKSVLIKIIAGLLKPDSGTVKVLGEEIGTLGIRDLQQLRSKIGFSFQSNALYDSMTVKENLTFPLVRNKRNLSSKEINEAIDEVLTNVGLPETINKTPSELSGGQKKRIGIARTLILKPQIMLYDEPTAGLDPITSIEINHLINEVRRQYNTSAVIITHDLTCAKTTGDNIAMIVDGRFATEGIFEEIFKSADPAIKGFYEYNFIVEPNTGESK